MSLQERLTERFLRYAAVPSQSKEGCAVVPSTPGQWDMAKLLKEDLAELGLVDLEISEFCVLTGRLPANLPAGHAPVPNVGWVAHMDTVDVNLSPEVHPQIVKNYQGGDVLLNAEKQIYIKVSEHPELNKYIGSDLITTDGTSVLAQITSCCCQSDGSTGNTIKENRPHGEIYVAFVPWKRLAFAVPRRWILASSRLNLLIPLTVASWARLYTRPLTQAAHTSKSRA